MKKKEITSEDKVNTFKDELGMIFDVKIREFTKLCIIAAPDYLFLNCPASSSSRYHPIDELSYDGTIIHTKRVFTVVYELCRGLGVENRRDILLSGSLIHDARKQGYTHTGHTQKNHPQYAVELIDEVQDATGLLTDEDHQTIRKCVGYHYGPWSISPWIKPLSEYSMEELVVYVSDYVASKRCVKVDYTR